MECNNVHASDVAVVMVPFPAQGHLNQLLHLSHIITSYGIPVHYAGSGPHNHQVKLRLNGWDQQNATQIHFHDFQLPDYKCVPPTTKPDPSMHFPVHFEPLFHACTHLRQPVHELLQQLSTKFRRVIVVHDSLMTTVVQDAKSIPNAESYVFIPVSAFTTFLGIWNDLPDKPFQLDSDFPRRIPSEEGTFTPEISEFIANQYQSLGMESGWVYNTSRLIEGQFLEMLEKLLGKKQFAIGPLNPGKAKTRSNDGQVVVQRHRCLEWLDKQEKYSVLYVAFGSTTSMTCEQTYELALGLERSGQKFIWVLRKADEVEDRVEEVPEGFQERIREAGVGIVVEGWAPQLQVLAHPAVGGFMSHCGWNSCIESMSMGVPLAAWPMHSEQPENCLLVSEVIKIAIVVRDWEHRNELVTSGTIENSVRTLMASKEGEDMRKRAAELGRSLSDGGASRLEMDSFISHITG